MVKYKLILKQMAEQWSADYQATTTAMRLNQIAEFGANLIKSGLFKSQLYEHIASIMTLLEQKNASITLYFPALLSLGSVTQSLARQHNWDQQYIQKVQSLYKMEDHDASRWMLLITKYLRKCLAIMRSQLNHHKS